MPRNSSFCTSIILNKGCCIVGVAYAFLPYGSKKHVYNTSIVTPDAFKKFSLLLKEKNLMSVKILQISILEVLTITV